MNTAAQGDIRWLSRYWRTLLPAVSGVVLVVALLTRTLLAPACASYDSLLGVYYGAEGWNIEQLQAMEAWQNKSHAVVNMFTDWCYRAETLNNLFDRQLPTIWKSKNVPMISWEPFICSAAGTPTDIEVQIAHGAYDAYINLWAERLKLFLSGPDATFGTGDDRRAFVRVGHEMNTNWYPWSAAAGRNHPDDYIRMWQHIKDIFDAKGLHATHIQWVWCVNYQDHGDYPAETFFPGDAYVDWIAVDGYNWGNTEESTTWKHPDEVFEPMLNRLRALSRKPIAIAEVGSSAVTSAGTDLTAKSKWIREFFSYARGCDVKMVVWFNSDKKAGWAVFGGRTGDASFLNDSQTYQAYAAYRSAIAADVLQPSNPDNPRLLTDEQFAGQ